MHHHHHSINEIKVLKIYLDLKMLRELRVRAAGEVRRDKEGNNKQ